MKSNTKTKLFYISFLVVFLFFLQKQFFSLLEINVLFKYEQSNSIGDFLILAILIPLFVFAFYYIPTLFVIELVAFSFSLNLLQINFESVDYSTINIIVLFTQKLFRKYNVIRCWFIV